MEIAKRMFLDKFAMRWKNKEYSLGHSVYAELFFYNGRVSGLNLQLNGVYFWLSSRLR